MQARFFLAAACGIAVFSASPALGQGVVEVWRQAYRQAGGANSDRAVDIGTSNSGPYIVGTSQISPGDERIVTVRYDLNGNILNTAWWPTTENPAPGAREAVGLQVVETTDTHIYVCGTIEGVGGKNDMAVIAYDAGLNLQWSRIYSHTPYEGFTDDDVAVAISATGEYAAVTGRSRSATGDWDYATLILNAATGSDAMTPRRYDNAGQGEVPSDVVVAGDRVHVTGLGENGVQGSDYLTIVYDIGDGGVVAGWPQYYHRCGADQAYAIALGRAGDVFVTGQTDAACIRTPPPGDPADFDVATLKYDPNGTLLWMDLYHDTSEVGWDVDVAADGAVDVVYVLGRTGFSTRDLLTFQYRDSGGAAVTKTGFTSTTLALTICRRSSSREMRIRVALRAPTSRDSPEFHLPPMTT